jgi:hypothetical protein
MSIFSLELKEPITPLLKGEEIGLKGEEKGEETGLKGEGKGEEEGLKEMRGQRKHNCFWGWMPLIFLSNRHEVA